MGSSSSPDIVLLRQNLAATVSPLMTAGYCDETNEQIAKGFQELRDLIVTGFAIESVKGELYEDLMEGLDYFIKRITEADESAATISFDHDKAFKFEDGSCQIGEAAYRMGVIAGVKAQREEIKEKFGFIVEPEVTSDRRPNADHNLLARQLGIVKNNIDKLMAGQVVESNCKPVKGFTRD